MAFIALLLVVGASGTIGQIVLLREFLVVASGNELAIGLFLGSWLLLEALGCLLADRLWARERPAVGFALCQALFALALPVALYATRCLRPLAGLSPGEALAAPTLLLASLLLLLPVSAPHGALFALAGRMRPGQRAGSIYGWQTLGALAGGLILTFWLIPHWHSFHIVLAVCAVGLASCLWLASGRVAAAVAVGLAVTLLAYGVADRLQSGSLQRQWPDAQIALYANSAYGNITVLKSEGQTVFLTDGEVTAVSPVPDIESVEEMAHFALLAHPRPQEVLVLGGGAGGLLREVLKHPVRRVDYAELDPLLLSALTRFAAPLTAGEFSDPRLSIHRADGRLFARRTASRYDAILIGAGRPQSLLANRLFTREFFALARSRLKPGGLLCFSLPGSSAYLEPPLASLNASVLQAASAAFGQVRAIPADTDLFLASDSPGLASLDAAELSRRLRQRHIQTAFVGPGQLSLRLEPQWTRRFEAFLSPVRHNAGINEDFNPRAVLHCLTDRSAMLSPGTARLFAWAQELTLPRLATALAVLLLAGLSWHRRLGRLSQAATPAATTITGFGAMAYNMVLIFAFQSLYGHVYLWVGLLVSAFMAGAGAGSLLLSSVSRPRRALLSLEAALALFSALLAWSLGWLAQGLAPTLLKGLFLFLALLGGGLTGGQFPVACLLPGPGAAALFSCDLLGGWLGAVAGGAFLLPALGLRDACLTVAAMKLSSLVFCAATLEETV